VRDGTTEKRDMEIEVQVDKPVQDLRAALARNASSGVLAKWLEFSKATKNKVVYTDGELTIYLDKAEAGFPNHKKFARVEITLTDE
jgi:hypothetical protein